MKRVTDKKETSLVPVVPAEFASLLPTVTAPVTYEFVIDGVCQAIASGLRRAVLSEIPVKTLTFSEFVCTDPHFKLEDYVLVRVRSIPLMQNVSPDSEFELNVVNSTAAPMTVYSSSFVQTKGKPGRWFDETIPIVTLAPSRSIKLGGVTVISGYETTHGTFCAVDAATAECLDVIPLNAYENVGVSSSVADPRRHRIRFNTSGTMPPTQIVKLAAGEIKRRLSTIRDLLYTMTLVDGAYCLVVPGENDTTGQIITKMTLELYADAICVPYVSPTNKQLTLRVVAPDSSVATDWLTSAIEAANGILDEIAAEF